MTDLIGSELGVTPLSKTSGVPTTDEPQKSKDFTSDQEVRWCPGCGDYVILNTIRNFLPELGLRRENIAFVSGIGCSSRFPYYLETYGFHSIHGRAPTIATGLALARPDLSVWVVTGDGDALSIGGNHLIHTLRRNVNLTILLFNNRIYGLTKGQYSPTSEVGKVTKSTPMGSLDHPFNPVSVALGAEATFVGRAMDSDRKGLTDVLRQAAEHQGTALVEIYQNCNIFNDGAFELLKDPATGPQWTIPLVVGEPPGAGPAGAGPAVDDPAGGRRAAGLRPGRRVVRRPRRVRRPADRRDQPGRPGADRRPRRHPRGPVVRLRAVPAVHPGPALHADGRLPEGLAADVRPDDGRAAGRGPDPGGRGSRRTARRQRHLDRQRLTEWEGSGFRSPPTPLTPAGSPAAARRRRRCPWGRRGRRPSRAARCGSGRACPRTRAAGTARAGCRRRPGAAPG